MQFRMIRERVTIAVAIVVAAGGLFAGISAASPIPVDAESPVTITPVPPVTDDLLPPPITTDIRSTEKPDLPSVSGGRPPTDAEAEAYLKQSIGPHESLTGSYVVRTTFGHVADLLSGALYYPAGYTADSPVVVVTGTGVFRPQFAYSESGKEYPGEATVLDAETCGMIMIASLDDVPEYLKAR